MCIILQQYRVLNAHPVSFLLLTPFATTTTTSYIIILLIVYTSYNAICMCITFNSTCLPYVSSKSSSSRFLFLVFFLLLSFGSHLYEKVSKDFCPIPSHLTTFILLDILHYSIPATEQKKKLH